MRPAVLVPLLALTAVSCARARPREPVVGFPEREPVDAEIVGLGGDTRAAIAEVRRRLLAGSAEEFGVRPRGPVWGVVVDFGDPVEGMTVQVVLSDGSARMYQGTVDLVFRDGRDDTVEAASLRLCEAAAVLATAGPGPPPPPPGAAGQIRFEVLTTAGPRAAQASKVELVSGKHQLSALYQAVMDVVHAHRHVSRNGQPW